MDIFNYSEVSQLQLRPSYDKTNSTLHAVPQYKSSTVARAQQPKQEVKTVRSYLQFGEFLAEAPAVLLNSMDIVVW